METYKSFCRICHANCATEVDVEDGELMAVRGDRDDPIYGGYTCAKGRQAVDHINHPDRLRTALKKQGDGQYVSIASRDAMDEIAAKLMHIIDRHGPRSVATYNGTHGFTSNGGWDSAQAFHLAIDSPSYFTSITVDQPAKFAIAPSRIGVWNAGAQDFDQSDVGMYIGNNPLISHYSGGYGSLPCFSPSRRLQDNKARGFKLIVIDPRMTELARKADLFLQIKPGEDPALLCGMLRVILCEQLHDREFCARHVDGLDALRAAIDDFTPDYVARRTDVPAEKMIAATRIFGQGPRGNAVTGTGPNMAPRAPLTEHLALCLNIICGRFKRAGDRVGNVNLMQPGPPRRAEVVPPWDVYRGGKAGRVRELRPYAAHRASTLLEYPAASLADEILTPGDGAIRALISVSGNPANSLPNQARMREALASLDLFVQLDIKMSASARMADYVIAGKTGYERAEVSTVGSSVPAPYAIYTAAIVPAKGDTLEEWEFFWEILHRLNLPMKFPTGKDVLRMDSRPPKDDMLKALFSNARIPLDTLKERKGGHIFEEYFETVLPAAPDANARLQLAPDQIPEEIREVRQEDFFLGGSYAGQKRRFSHRLVCRRLGYAYNSALRDLPKLGARGRRNPAFLNAEDLQALGLRTGDPIEICSASSCIVAIAEATDEIRPGVISFAHGWGDLGSDSSIQADASNVNQLTDAEIDFDKWTGMGIQSGIPVNIRRPSS